MFSVGIGPLAWFISTELTGPTCRARVQSLSISAQYISCFICPTIYFPLQKIAGPFSFLLFIVPLLLSAFYMYFYLPETKNRSAENIRAVLENCQVEWATLPFRRQNFVLWQRTFFHFVVAVLLIKINSSSFCC